jgi:uncharacterized Tic20 family protein
MKTFPDFLEFVVSLLVLIVLSFTLLAGGYSIEALALQLMIIVAVIGDICLFCLFRE